MPLKIFIDPGLPFIGIIRYVFQIISENKGIDFKFIDEDANADIRITASSSSDFIIAKEFYEKLEQEKFSFASHFSEKCLVKSREGGEDILSTIFYCVNALQEYNSESDDELGRFQYRKSYQAKFNNVQDNLVQEMIDRICSHPKLVPLIKTRRKSKVFLTHDIDSIHGAWKEDGFYALKKLKPVTVFNLMLNEALGKPDWLNIDRIRRIEDEQGFRSVFYWLVYKDRRNADYEFESEKIRKEFHEINSSGWENGLHKSLRPATFREEVERMGVEVKGNRFHYLNFKLPQGYSEIENSGLKLDTSLGFFEQWGFRNSYGLPFMPYNLREKRVFDFIEVPMQIMDRTFFSRRMEVSEVKKLLIGWFEKNKYDCIFSLNFHNNFFSDFKYGGYASLYRSLLSYFKESGFEGVTQSELIKEFYKPDKFSFTDRS